MQYDDASGETAVSVVIPVYNAERYMRECLASVLGQRGVAGLEVICVDDGSTDDSVEILKDLQRQDSRIKILSQANQGPGVARNTGIAAARGEYVTFLDADDKFASHDILARTLQSAQSRNLDILLASGDKMTCSGRILVENCWLFREYLPDKDVFRAEDAGIRAFQLATLTPWAKLFKREFLNRHELRFPPLMHGVEDTPFVIVAIVCAERIGALAESMVCYRQFNSDSLEGAKDDCPIAFIAAEDWLYEKLDEIGVSPKILEAAYWASINYFHYAMRGGISTWKSFRTVAGEVAKRLPVMRISDRSGFTKQDQRVLGFVESVAAAIDDEDELRVLFAQSMLIKYENVLKSFGRPAPESIAKDAKIAQLRQIIEGQKGQIDKLSETVGAKDNSIERLRDNNAKQSDAITHIKTNIETLRSALTAREGALAQLRDCIKARDESIAKLRDGIKIRDGSLAQLRDAVENKDKALAQLRSTVAGLKDRVERQNAVIVRQNARNARRGNAMDGLKSELGNSERIAGKESEPLDKLRG